MNFEAEDDLKLLVLLPPPLEFKVYVVLRLEPRASCVLDEHFPNWATMSTCSCPVGCGSLCGTLSPSRT